MAMPPVRIALEIITILNCNVDLIYNFIEFDNFHILNPIKIMMAGMQFAADLCIKGGKK